MNRYRVKLSAFEVCLNVCQSSAWQKGMEVPNADFQIIHALHARVNGKNRKRSTQRPSRATYARLPK